MMTMHTQAVDEIDIYFPPTRSLKRKSGDEASNPPRKRTTSHNHSMGTLSPAQSDLEDDASANDAALDAVLPLRFDTTHSNHRTSNGPRIVSTPIPTLTANRPGDILGLHLRWLHRKSLRCQSAREPGADQGALQDPREDAGGSARYRGPRGGEESAAGGESDQAYQGDGRRAGSKKRAGRWGGETGGRVPGDDSEGILRSVGSRGGGGGGGGHYYYTELLLFRRSNLKRMAFGEEGLGTREKRQETVIWRWFGCGNAWQLYIRYSS